MMEKSIHVHKTVQGTSSAWRAISAWIDLGTTGYTSHPKSTCVVQVLSCNCIFNQLSAPSPRGHSLPVPRRKPGNERKFMKTERKGWKKLEERKPDGSARFSYFILSLPHQNSFQTNVGMVCRWLHGINAWYKTMNEENWLLVTDELLKYEK